MVRRYLEYLAVLFHTLIITFIGPVLGVPTLLWLLYVGSIYRFLAIMYIVHTYVTWNLSECGGNKSRWLETSLYTSLIQSYFPMCLVRTATLDENKNYIVGLHPHGLLTYHALMFMDTKNENFKQELGKLRPLFCTAAYNMQVPVQRDYFLAMGSVRASEESITHVVTKQGPGNLAGIVIGGPKEVFQSRKDEVHLNLKNRKGFCRVALKTGAQLLPTYAFGENDLYSFAEFPENNIIRRIQRYICNNFHLALPILKGEWKFQYMFVMPKRTPITIVLGKPITVEKVANPTKDQIDQLHSQYMKSLEELFNNNKARYCLNPNTKLIFE